jgi:hypothetical protein
MASPTPIYVSPSTTIVQVNPLSNPYTSVILNAYQYAGQVITVLDGTSSFGAVQTPIVVSTAAATQFLDGSVSTLINQPQGYLTVQANAPNLWSVLNSFPFRNQYLSAGTQNLTVSSLYSASVSTLQEFTSSLVVENLRVSGNFSQSSAIILNQTISSLGTADFYSSMTVWQSTFFSSGFSTIGAVSLLSSLNVTGNVITSSPLTFFSSVAVGNASVVESFSTALVRLGQSFNTQALIVQNSSLQAVNVGSDLDLKSVVAFGALNVGGNLQSQTTYAQSFSTLSSFFGTDLVVTGSTVFHSTFSTQGGFVSLGHLSTGSDTTVQGNMDVRGSLVAQGSTFVKGLFSTVNLVGESIVVSGNFQVDPTHSNPTRIESATINRAFGVGNIHGSTILVGGTLSTSADLYAKGSLSLNTSLFIARGSLSTLSSFSTAGDLYVLKGFSTLGSVFVSSSVDVLGNLYTGASYWNQSNLSSSYIVGDLSILGNLTVTQTMKLSSITLVSSVVANSFETSTMAAAYQGIVSSVSISSLLTSTFASGDVLYPAATVDMNSVLKTENLSTSLISSLLFEARSLLTYPVNTFAFSSFFQARSSFGVQTIASPNTFDVNTIAYSLCNATVLQRISAGTVNGGILSGTLSGDGQLLSNTAYPRQLSTFLVETSSLRSQRLEVSSFFASTLRTDQFTSRYLLKVGQFTVYGSIDASAQEIYLARDSVFLAAPTNVANLLQLNALSIFGDTFGLVTPQVVLNSNALYSSPFPQTSPYTLAIGSTLRVSTVISPNFLLPVNTLLGEQINANTFRTNALYLSSGSFGPSSGTFFLPEGQQVQVRSTNTIQPYLSTLIFNSTLFLSYETSSVGINTFPFYKLDVHTTAYAPNGVQLSQSTLITNGVTANPTTQNVASLAIGVSSPRNQIQFYNNPTTSFTASLTSPFVAYRPSTVEVNKALFLDASQNIRLASQVDYATTYQSTFCTNGNALVSGFFSTNHVIFENGFYLQMQNV